MLYRRFVKGSGAAGSKSGARVVQSLGLKQAVKARIWTSLGASVCSMASVRRSEASLADLAEDTRKYLQAS